MRIDNIIKEEFLKVRGADVWSFVCDIYVAEEKLNSKSFDVAPTEGLPEYNGTILKQTSERPLQPLVFTYYDYKCNMCTRVAENFVLYYQLHEEIDNNKIVGYYRYDENGEKERVIIIYNDEYLLKVGYVTDFIRKNNKVLLFYTEENFEDKKDLEFRKQELENEGKKTFVCDLSLYSRFLLK